MASKSSKVQPESQLDKDGKINTKIAKGIRIDSFGSKEYFNRSDIIRKSIQVFYTERDEKKSEPANHKRPFYLKVLHPNGRFRRVFDIATVIWVLILVFMIPFEIGFSWYEVSSGQKIFLNLLDFWFAVDIILNFRTGYIHHGTIIMNPKKIVS